MSILPVSVTRTNDLHSNLRLMRQINADEVGLQRLYDQLSTSRRVLLPSDDAPAATRALLLSRSLELSQQHLRNTQASQRILNSTDGLLSDLESAVIDSRALAIEGAQTVLSAEERATLTQELRLTIEQLIASGNRNYEGQFLLAGAQDRQPLSRSTDYVRWNANHTVLESFLTSESESSVSSNVLAAFGLNQGQITGTAELLPALSPDTLLADLNAGEGIEATAIRLLDPGSGTWKTVEFTGVTTVGELIDRIESIQLDGRALQASIVTDRVTLGYADGLPGSLVVDESLGGTFANQIGWLNPLGTSAPPLGARDLELSVTSHTPLASLLNGTGIDVTAGLQITQGSEHYTIDLSQAETLGDVLIALNRSPADIHATLDPRTNRIQVYSLRSGVDLGIGENGGTVAEQLGIRTATAATLLADLNHGAGISLSDGPDFTITRTDGVTLELDLQGLESIEDVLNAINSHTSNTGANQVTASLATTGNGIVLTSVAGAAPIAVQLSNSSDAAWILGLVPRGEQSATGTVSAGVSRFEGKDFHGRALGGLLDTIQRLERAIEASDFGEIARLQAVLDRNTTVLDAERASLGIQLQAAQAIQVRIEDDNVRLQSGISDNLDADLAQIVSEISLRQASLEASLRFVGQTSQLSLLDFL